MEKAASYGALSDSIDLVLRGEYRKNTYSGRWILEHREEFIKQCQERMLNGTFKIESYQEYEILERGKVRHIQCVKIPDRIVINALMKEVQHAFRREFIHTTASSIEGRGGLWLHKLVVKMRKEHPEIRWFYKCDIRKYYESIPQDKLLDLIDKKFREKSVKHIMRECITLMPSGISIGLRSSQEFGNIYLSHYVDHRLKDGCGCKWYFRYCDDIVIAAEAAEELTVYIMAVHEGAREAGLDIKPNEQVFPIDARPLDFLGYILFENGRIAVRKHIKQRFARRWKRVKSRTRRKELVGSFFGMAKHADSKHLFNKITGYNMKDFSELGVSYVAQDGKKHFDCPTVSLNDLQNCTIIVKDYEMNVQTKNGDRMLVLFDDEDGHEGKFFTASEELKQLMEKIDAAGEIPFRTTIVRKRMSENKYKYCFT